MADVVLIARAMSRQINGKWFDVTQYGDGHWECKQVVDKRPVIQIPPPQPGAQIPPPQPGPRRWWQHRWSQTSRRTRVVTLIVLLLGLMAVAAQPARAVDIPNPIGGVGDAILERICPPRQAPYPESPGDPVIKRGGGNGLYATYGYGGLRWTTWDAGCLSWDKADTSMGTQINATVSGFDETINELQMAALDDSTTASFDDVIVRAINGLRAAFWNPWSMTGLAVVGLLMIVYVITGRETDAMSAMLSAVVVLGLIFLIFQRPALPMEIGNGMTSGVAQGVASSLIAQTPGGTMPAGSTAQEKFGEGFYQVSYRAWLEGWSCGDADAEARYGRRLLDAQAFSVPQYLATKDNPAAATALVKAKGEEWMKIGEQMEKTNPLAFGCWKGAGSSRTGAAIKHAIVTFSAGFWIVLGSIALLALKWVLRIAVLFAVAFGAFIIFSRRLQDRMMEYVLLGLLGPLFIAAAVGVLLWGYYAILLDREAAWWQAGISAFALGLALWFSKGPLQRMFVGVSEGGRVGHMARAGGRKVRTVVASRSAAGGTAGAAATAATAGAAAGAVVAGTVLAHNNDDHRRDDDDGAGTYSRTERDMDSTDGPREEPREVRRDDAPAQALQRARVMAAAKGAEPEGFARSERWASTDDNARDGHDETPSVDEVRAVVTGDPEYGRGDS